MILDEIILSVRIYIKNELKVLFKSTHYEHLDEEITLVVFKSEFESLTILYETYRTDVYIIKHAQKGSEKYYLFSDPF